MSDWHILRVEPNREVTVSGHLIGRRIRPYVPMLRESRKRSVPMFGPYIFVHIDPDQPWAELSIIRQGKPLAVGDVVHSGFRNVTAGQRAKSVPGALDFLRMPNGRYATLSDAAIAAISALAFELDHLKDAEDPGLTVGTSVRTRDRAGAWSGFLGVVERLDKHDRVAVSLILPGRQMTVSLPAQWLEPIADAPPRGRLAGALG